MLDQSLHLHTSILLVLMILLLKVKFSFDMPHDHQIVRTLQHLSSKNTVQEQPFLRIPHLYTILSIAHHQEDFPHSPCGAATGSPVQAHWSEVVFWMFNQSAHKTSYSDLSIAKQGCLVFANGRVNSSHKAATAPLTLSWLTKKSAANKFNIVTVPAEING